MPATSPGAHHPDQRARLPAVADEPAESKVYGDRDHQRLPDLDEVGQRRRVLEGMRGIRIEEAAAIGASRLIATWLATDPSAMVCFAPSSVVASTKASIVCGDPERPRPERR